jgi:hypothetical protein
MNKGVNLAAIFFGITAFAAVMSDTVDHWLTLAVIVFGGGGLLLVVLREVAKELWFKFEMAAMNRHEADRQLAWAHSTQHIPKSDHEQETVPVILEKADDG